MDNGLVQLHPHAQHYRPRNEHKAVPMLARGRYRKSKYELKAPRTLVESHNPAIN